MSRLRKDRGFVLVWALIFGVIVAVMLDVLARRAWFAGRDADARAAREEALHVARGALRTAAARARDGERLSATAGGVRVSAVWRGGRLSDWEDE